GAEGERSDAAAHQAPLPRGEWLGGEEQSDAAGSPGGRRVDGPSGGAEDTGPHHQALQRGTAAQRLGLLATGGLLPREPEDAARGTTAEASTGPAPPQGNEPGPKARHVALPSGGACTLRTGLVCATSVETNHRQYRQQR